MKRTNKHTKAHTKMGTLRMDNSKVETIVQDELTRLYDGDLTTGNDYWHWVNEAFDSKNPFKASTETATAFLMLKGYVSLIDQNIFDPYGLMFDYASAKDIPVKDFNTAMATVMMSLNGCADAHTIQMKSMALWNVKGNLYYCLNQR